MWTFWRRLPSLTHPLINLNCELTHMLCLLIQLCVAQLHPAAEGYIKDTESVWVCCCRLGWALLLRVIICCDGRSSETSADFRRYIWHTIVLKTLHVPAEMFLYISCLGFARGRWRWLTVCCEVQRWNRSVWRMTLETIRLPCCVELGVLGEFSPFGSGMSEGCYCRSEGIFLLEIKQMCCDQNNMCWEVYYMLIHWCGSDDSQNWRQREGEARGGNMLSRLSQSFFCWDWCFFPA